ncbi:DNA repair helicase XPD [Tanacetum coccineum]|uniref:DNA repair helicase XPD n=1 Tax=Tanacetum coccineum TaxID=301880 RepID=A0ABQ4XRR8_9ASTR
MLIGSFYTDRVYPFMCYCVGKIFSFLNNFQLSCHDASLAIKPVFDRFQSVVITSGTLSPIDLYPRLLNFNPVVSRSFTISLTRDCICPMVLTCGSDQLPVSTKFNLRSDPGEIMQRILVFIETQDVVETTLALDNYRKACDCGRGAVFFSVARGKVAEVGERVDEQNEELKGPALVLQEDTLLFKARQFEHQFQDSKPITTILAPRFAIAF